MDPQDPERVILHIIVIGFHHKRGSEVRVSELEATCKVCN